MTSGDTTAAWTSRRSTARSREVSGASRKTVLVALASNVTVMIAKFIGGLFSGSSAMFAEAAHSLADTVNEIFLLVSISQAAQEPTPEQPFGYGRMRFLWTFLAAIAMFLAGAVFAVGFGTYRLIEGAHVSGDLGAYIALGIAAVTEGMSWARAVHQVRGEARDAGLGVVAYVRGSRDPNVKMVLFEDTAALIGVALAFAGVLLGELTGSPVFDPAASIAIGLLLIGVAALMSHDTSGLLVGAAARPSERRVIAAALEEFGEIHQVIEVLTMVLGPNSLLVAARLDFADGLSDSRVESVSDAIERRLRDAVPDVTEVFLDATTAPTGPGARRRRRSAGSGE